MTILNLDQYKLIHPRGWNFSIPLEVLKDWMKLRQLDFVRDEGFFCITLETSNNMSYNLWIEYGKPVGGKTTMKWKRGQGLVPRDTVPLGPRPFLRPAWTKGIAGNNQKLQEYFIQCLGERT